MNDFFFIFVILYISMSWFKKIFGKEKKETLDKGLEKSNRSIFDKIGRAIAGKSKVDEEVLDD